MFFLDIDVCVPGLILFFLLTYRAPRIITWSAAQRALRDVLSSHVWHEDLGPNISYLGYIIKENRPQKNIIKENDFVKSFFTLLYVVQGATFATHGSAECFLRSRTRAAPLPHELLGSEFLRIPRPQSRHRKIYKIRTHATRAYNVTRKAHAMQVWEVHSQRWKQKRWLGSLARPPVMIDYLNNSSP